MRRCARQHRTRPLQLTLLLEALLLSFESLVLLASSLSLTPFPVIQCFPVER
jgi:hypothetical protein